jgi:hypothetical protein
MFAGPQQRSSMNWWLHLWFGGLAQGNPFQMEFVMGKSSINKGLFIAKFDYRRVCVCAVVFMKACLICAEILVRKLA